MCKAENRENLSFSKQGDEYIATIEPEKEGFHTIDGYELAANYPLEYQKIGFNTDVKTTIEEQNGTVYPLRRSKNTTARRYQNKLGANRERTSKPKDAVHNSSNNNIPGRNNTAQGRGTQTKNRHKCVKILKNLETSTTLLEGTKKVCSI